MSCNRSLFFGAVLLAAGLPGAGLCASGGSAADAVRPFYLPEPLDETAAAERGRFTEPALGALRRDDASSKNGEEVGCIDGVLAIDAQDFDAAVIARTLKLSETVTGQRATVRARFRLFASGDDTALHEIVWTLKRVGGAWKVADIEAPGSWRLSTMCRD